MARGTGEARDSSCSACDYDQAIESGRIDGVWVPEAGAREELLARHRRDLEQLASPLRDRGLKVTVDVVWDHPLDAAVIKKAAARDYWLVAKGTHHHNALQRTLLTQTDWHLIRKCPAPLLLVKDRHAVGRAERARGRRSIERARQAGGARRPDSSISARISLASSAGTCTSCTRSLRRWAWTCRPTFATFSRTSIVRRCVSFSRPSDGRGAFLSI